MVVFIACIALLTQLSPAYSITIIESQRTYPEVLTIDDTFAICVQIKKDHPCREDTINITYTYGEENGELYPLKEYIENYHFKLDELPETHLWCGEATASYEYSVYTSITCLDNLNNVRSDYHVDVTTCSHIFIETASSFENERIFGKHIGDEIEIVTYIDNYSDIYMYYTLYNITEGIIPYILKEEIPKIEGQYKVNFTIPSSAPFGFIELEVNGSYGKGGKFISYAAIPYTSEIEVSGETIMDSTIDITLDIDIEYGKINSVETIVILPNSTEQKIYLDHVNTSTEYKIPMRPGNYTIESTIYHTILDNKKTTRSFYVREYNLDIDSGIKVYEQGDTVTIKAGVTDSNNIPVDMEIKSICIRPVGGSDECFGDNDDEMTIENKYHKLVYTIDEEAETGEYLVKVSAEDKYDLDYSGNESFIVNAKDRTIQFTISPSTLYRNINSMNKTEDEFTITNTGTNTMESVTITKDPGELSRYITISKTNFTSTLDPGDTTTFTLIIQACEDMENKLYHGNISVASDTKSQNLQITLDITLAAEMTIINKTIDIKALIGKGKNIYIVIENAGTRSLTDMTATLSGTLEEYKDMINLPDEITPDMRENIEIKLKPIHDLGTYDGEVEISAGNISGKVEISLEVVEDISDDIDDVDDKRRAMNQRLDRLNSGGAASDIKDDLEELQTDISEMRSQYNNGQYSEARSMLTRIQDKADAVDTALRQLESTQSICGDGTCDDDETCTSCYEDCKDELGCEDTKGGCNYDGVCDWDDDEDCSCEDCEFEDECDDSGGGSPILIIIVIIVVVIIVVVVATSIVPDDNGRGSIPRQK